MDLPGSLVTPSSRSDRAGARSFENEESQDNSAATMRVMAVASLVLVLATLLAQLQHTTLEAPRRLQRSGMVVILLRSRERAVPEHALGDVHMRGIVGRDGGRGTVPEQVGAHRPPELGLGQIPDLIVDGLLAHGRAIAGYPKRRARRTKAAPSIPPGRSPGGEEPVVVDVALEIRDEKPGKWHLDGRAVLGLLGLEAEPISVGLADQVMADLHRGEVRPAEWPDGQ